MAKTTPNDTNRGDGEFQRIAPAGRYDFRAMADELAKLAPSDDELRQKEAAAARVAREARLENVRGVVTDDDLERLVYDDLEETDALRAVRQWRELREKAPRPISMLVLLGETGRGKTLAAGWLVAELGGLYVSAEELRRAVRSVFAQDREWFDKLVRARVVVVDDVGTEQDAESARSALFELVNKRQGLARAWTVITGNLSRAEFVERYGERTVRRIEHQGAIVECVGPDLRREGL